MSLIEKCAREAADDLFLSSAERAYARSRIITHFAPVAEAMEKAEKAIKMAEPDCRTHAETLNRIGEALAALEAAK